MPKVLHLLPQLNHGGVERHLVDLSKLGPLHVASAGGCLVEHMPDHTVHWTLPLHHKKAILSNAFRLARIIKENGYQLLHVHSRAPAWSAWVAHRLTGIPWISTYHGTYNAASKGKYFYNSIMVRGQGVIAISEFIAKTIEEQYSNLHPKIFLVREGIDTTYFKKDHLDPRKIQTLKKRWGTGKVILLPARLTRWKGQLVLLEALRLLPPDTTVVFIGDGKETYRKELQEKAQGLSVVFESSWSDMRLPYAACDLVLNCSTDPEAFGRVTAEALSMGSLFIGTNHGATPEMVDQRFLMPPGDPRALAQKIQEALSMPEESKVEVLQKAQEKIERLFSLKAMEQGLEKAYEKIIKTSLIDKQS